MKPAILFLRKSAAGIIVCLMLFSGQTWATHAAGADFTYRCLGGLTYELTISFYRDCGGVAEPNSIDIKYRTLTGAYTAVRNATALKDLSSGIEITTPCATASTKCTGGIYTGIRQWKYKTIVTLPDTASDWVFSYTICCRNCVITTINSPCANGISNLYVEATLNNADGNCNNSPVFSNFPLAFTYVGQNFNYNHGVIDEDGDSLAYSIITPRFNASTYVTYVPPHTTSNPILTSTPFTVNAVTGDLNFTPSQVEVGILTFLVKEYRNGKLIGSVMRDMQVYTTLSSNQLPTLTGINGTADNSITVCPGTPVNFSVFSMDADSSQDVTLTTNNSIPGADYTIIPGSRPRLDFSWTPGPGDAGPNPHVFTVTVKDNACGLNGVQVYSFSITVTAPAFNIYTNNVSCNGRNDGSATVVYNGNYNFLWSNGEILPVNDSLGEGIYIVTVTDIVSGCKTTDSALVSEPAGTAISAAIVPAQCANLCNGSITVSTDSIANPAFLWNSGDTTLNLSSLCAGEYVITVFSNGQCIQSATYTVQQSTVLEAELAATNIICPQSTSGSIDLTVTGGIQPYAYLWNTSASTEDIAGLEEGTYQVTVTDQQGCALSAITQVIREQSLTVTASITHAKCRGSATGFIIVIAGNGDAPYTYQWNNGATSPSIYGLSAGTYAVTVTENNGCTASYSYTIEEPHLPLEISVTSTSPLCAGSSDGTIDLSVAGGLPPYAIAWNTGDSLPYIGNLPSGIYTVSVTDSNQCRAADTIVIDSPPALSAEGILSNIACKGDSTGSIELTAGGGKPPYAFIWNNGASSEDIYNLHAGTYSVTITDSSGCSLMHSWTLLEPQQTLQITLTPQPVACKGQTGSIQAHITGGTLPYTILWNNGETAQNIQNLPAGIYAVTVHDVNGCSATSATTINEPATSITSGAIVQQVKCKGTSTGAVMLHPSGGTGPHYFLWNTGATTASIVNIYKGVYTVTITDAAGCTLKQSYPVSEPKTPLKAEGLVADITCLHPFGTIGLNVSGGAGSYTILWQNGMTGPLADNLAEGTYSVSISDTAGCVIDTSFEITNEINPVKLAITTSPSACLNGMPGSANVSVTGGTAPFSYLWNNSTTTSSVENIYAGTYSVRVKDALGCIKDTSVTINDTSVLKLNHTGNAEICAGNTIKLSVTEPAGFILQWYYNGMQLPGANGASFITPAAGLYSVTAEGPCGTVRSDTVNVTTRSLQNVSISNDVIICAGEEVRIIAGGGTSYKWSPQEGLNDSEVPDPLASPLKTTTYTVTITDEAGCKASADIVVSVLCDTLDIPNGYSPNNDGINDEFVIDGLSNYPDNALFIYNRWGTLIYKERNYNNKWNGRSNVQGTWFGQMVPDGTYFYILDLQDNGKPLNGYVIIKR